MIAQIVRSRRNRGPDRIQYPSRFADELEIAVIGDAGRYQGYPASVCDDVPYVLIIKYD